MTIRHGTRIVAEGGPYLIEGRLIGDHDDLDGHVHVLTADNEVLILNGWLFTFEIVSHAVDRRPVPPSRPGGPTGRPKISLVDGRPSVIRRISRYPWQRPWYLRD